MRSSCIGSCWAPGSPGDPRGWVAAFSATLLLDVIGAFTISAAISLHGGGWDWGELRESVLEGAGAAVGNTSLALVAVLVLERDVRAAWLLLVVAGILQVAYRAYTALGHGHARLERLYGFASSVGRSDDLNTVQEAILAHTRSAVDATTAGLVIIDAHQRPVRMVVMSEDGTVQRSEAPGTTAWWTPALVGEPVVSHRKGAERSTDGREAIAVPLHTRTAWPACCSSTAGLTTYRASSPTTCGCSRPWPTTPGSPSTAPSSSSGSARPSPSKPTKRP